VSNRVPPACDRNRRELGLVHNHEWSMLAALGRVQTLPTNANTIRVARLLFVLRLGAESLLSRIQKCFRRRSNWQPPIGMRVFHMLVS